MEEFLRSKNLDQKVEDENFSKDIDFFNSVRYAFFSSKFIDLVFKVLLNINKKLMDTFMQQKRSDFKHMQTEK